MRRTWSYASWNYLTSCGLNWAFLSNNFVSVLRQALFSVESRVVLACLHVLWIFRISHIWECFVQWRRHFFILGLIVYFMAWLIFIRPDWQLINIFSHVGLSIDRRTWRNVIQFLHLLLLFFGLLLLVVQAQVCVLEEVGGVTHELAAEFVELVTVNSQAVPLLLRILAWGY